MLLARVSQLVAASSGVRLLVVRKPVAMAGLWKSTLQSGRGKGNCLKTNFPNSRRNYSDQPRQPNRTEVQQQQQRTRTLKEKLMGPPSENAFSMGKGALAGAAMMGLLGLCYYGMGMSKETSIYDHSMMWPQYVRDRIHATYAYFGGSCLLTGLSSAAVFQSEALLRLISQTGWVATLITLGLVMGTGALAQALEYEPGLGVKQLAWALHTAVMGAVVAPMCLVGGPILIRALLYTAGIVGSLSTLAVCAPSEKFLNMGGPLAIGLGILFVSSLASMWLPPTTAVGAGLASISLYGGIILFSGFLLYDTQRIIQAAETHPEYSRSKFDPINQAMGIYMDALNIFIRLVVILSSGDQRKK